MTECVASWVGTDNTAVIRGQTGEAWEPENQIKLFGCREAFLVK